MSGTMLSIRIYLIIYGALLLLLGLTVFIAEIDLGSFMLLATLVIAAIKAALVVFYFMHLKASEPVTKLVAGAALLWLSLLIGLTMCDVVNRPDDSTHEESSLQRLPDRLPGSCVIVLLQKHQMDEKRGDYAT